MHDTPIADADIDQLLDELNRGIDEPEKRLRFDAVHREAIKTYVDMQACPGSGKTTLIGFKLLLLARKWAERYCGICVLTHSNAAKEEILHRLRMHPAGHKLLAYPHFLGTIQDFVNTFLALPFARSRGWEVRLAEPDRYAHAVEATGWKKVADSQSGKKYSFTYYFKANRIKPTEFVLTHEDGSLAVSEAFLSAVTNCVDVVKSGIGPAYLLEQRERLCQRGVFQYREMYALADQVLHDNPELLQAIRARFPVLIVDEMQDTQKFQDELINRIFRQQEGCCIQRLGDPDQSIFDGIGGEQPNSSYNDASLGCIAQSHRFSPDIAQKITGLSYRQLKEIRTSRSDGDGIPANSILLYDNASVGNVLERFGDLVIQLPKERRKTVKALGGVATQPTDKSLTIKSYWPLFDKAKNAHSPRLTTLCQAVRHCAELRAGHVGERYQTLMHSVLDLLARTGKATQTKSGKTLPFSQHTLRRFLRSNGQELAFRELLTEAITGPSPTKEDWPQWVSRLKKLLDLGQCNDSAEAFLCFDGANGIVEVEAASSGNVYHCGNGVSIEVSTIHGIKGETHDATLILETKYNKLFDVQEMIPYLCDPTLARPSSDPAHPNTQASIRASFMKRLYVAASRPRHLLCVAMHKDRVLDAQRELLQGNKGWVVVEI